MIQESALGVKYLMILPVCFRVRELGDSIPYYVIIIIILNGTVKKKSKGQLAPFIFFVRTCPKYISSPMRGQIALLAR